MSSKVRGNVGTHKWTLDDARHDAAYLTVPKTVFTAHVKHILADYISTKSRLLFIIGIALSPLSQLIRRPPTQSRHSSASRCPRSRRNIAEWTRSVTW